MQTALLICLFLTKKQMHTFIPYTFSYQDIESRADKILQDKYQLPNRQQVLKKIVGLIDLTTLSGDDTNQKVKQLCMTAVSFKNEQMGIPEVAAVCVYPVFAQIVHDELKGTAIGTACVAGAFPSSQSPLNLRLAEVEYAIQQGADEIDMVISRGKLIEGNEEFVYEEVNKIKEVCGKHHLKVILETGELKSVELIRKASELSILAGGDFLKTSTGKIQPAATPEAFLIMLDTIKEYYDKTGIMIGIKAAGGIAEPDEAIQYYLLVKSVLGEEWISPKYFRIGASRLAGKLVAEIEENQ